MFDTNRTRLGCEALEARDTPAGNVVATLSGGSWYLRGDAAGNEINVVRDGSGNVTVYGVGGTTINGQASVNLGPVSTSGWRRTGIYVDLGAGNDYLETHGMAVPSRNVERFGGDYLGPVAY
ncbi:MAG: hypothetical protein K2X87_13895 [Gemmataceae bacterium]|nr:hypothetical protein [Gemmataceae bacterium]